MLSQRVYYYSTTILSKKQYGLCIKLRIKSASTLLLIPVFCAILRSKAANNTVCYLLVNIVNRRIGFMISTRELAELAGVSQSTISRCLNDHPSISFETKERVRKLALQYGYVDHQRGHKALLSGKRRTIGILVTGNPFFDDLFINYTLNLLMTKAAEKNYYVIPLPLSTHEEGGLEKLRDLIRLNIVDSFIILHRRFDLDLHQYLKSIGIPHIYLLHCSRASYQAVDIVDSDNYAGGYLGTEHLISHGHRDIITVTCPWREYEDRTNGYRQALLENGIPFREDYVLTVNASYKSAYEAVQARLDLFSQATAVYVQSDILTLGVANALQDAGFRIPEDISIIGSDGYTLGAISHPQFDSVAHPISELVELALSRLTQIAEKRNQTPRQIILKPYIIERNSVTRKESPSMKSMLIPIEEELQTRIELNFQRLSTGDYYSIGDIFSPMDYDWYADKEGRALLAFMSHYKLSGRAIPCMAQMLSQMESRLNPLGYFGPIFETEIHEQQLSGHSWLLRGLCEHYQVFGDAYCLQTIRRITENLYLPLLGKFSSYPIDRSLKKEGGVSGSEIGIVDGWILSSDVGCAFMSIDGLSHAYQVTKDGRIRELLNEMIRVYLAIDKVSLQAQTHCTLTAARGMVRMYIETRDAVYLQGAEEIAKLYFEGGGMTATYQNLNWWGRPDSWTEPCAIVDSLMLAGELYKLTQKESYRTLAARIYHNGLATAQRDNGGAGTDSVVVAGGSDTLIPGMYEAFFCCTMRLSEGLWYINANRELFAARVTGKVTRQGDVYADGDILYAQLRGGEEYAEKQVEVDGLLLSPILKFYRIPKEIMVSIHQKILF